MTALLADGARFISSVPTSSSSNGSPWKPTSVKRYASSVSPVQLYQRVVTAEDLSGLTGPDKQPRHRHGAETWVLRRSVHEDAAVTGTASWAEWESSFKEDHAAVEMAFTATVVATSELRQWDCTGLQVDVEGHAWTDITLKLEESVHKLPAPLNQRVFPVLQATAAKAPGDDGRREFLVVQVACRDSEASKRNSGAVLGAYTSVERFKKTPDGIEWLMGTVSDAKGVLPGWMQKMAVPGAVAKDVDMFLAWISKERKKRSQ